LLISENLTGILEIRSDSGNSGSTKSAFFPLGIDTLNERYNKKEIDIEELLNGLSLLVVKRK
jgi:hypothetical protein